MKDSVIIVSGGMDSITLLYDKKDEIALGISFNYGCLLYTSPSPRDRQKSRMPSSA